jgi:hypothetical protein
MDGFRAEWCPLCGVFAAGFGFKIPNFAIQGFFVTETPENRNAWMRNG